MNQDGLQGETVRTDCQDGVTSIRVQVIQRCPEHRLLARFLLRPLGARRFRSFDKAGRPQLRSHSCASSIVGSTHPSCGLLIYIAEYTCVCVHRPLVPANYAAAASWVGATAAPDAYFPVSAAAAASPFCAWLVLRTHLSHHLLRTFTCSRGNHRDWELYLHTNACGLLSMTGGDHLYEYTFSALRQDLRFGHVLDRATSEGQKQHVHTRVCPSNLAMGRHLLRTVKCREGWELRVPLSSKRNLPSS